ncbi:MAG: glutamate formimidoyltransferase [Prevotellaceae bacterium]|jgi:glutamate formiminotransferase/formiminotetrahydrofolate cyclodeaminase|nr:glutamate formimidoyltransferase [Prevotellaceae bacterium]
MKQLIECIPNFSEGRDPDKVQQIAKAIESVPGINLLNIDSGADANRTVITFSGQPGDVCTAAFEAIKIASEIIDMRAQRGKHPRIGSADVCPFVPLENISMDETVEYARELAKRVGNELQIPVYCYENAAFVPERRELAYCRKGEYEALKQKLAAQKPDFGPDTFSVNVAKTGATIIGARNPLIAVNFNLGTKSKEIASQIAAEIREKGKNDTDAKLKGINAIGWYIADYDIAQVSVNITDINATPLYKVFEEVGDRAAKIGIDLTGTEIIGLIPEKALLDSGRYFLSQTGRSGDLSKEVLLETAIERLGLNDVNVMSNEQ